MLPFTLLSLLTRWAVFRLAFPIPLCCMPRLEKVVSLKPELPEATVFHDRGVVKLLSDGRPMRRSWHSSLARGEGA